MSRLDAPARSTSLIIFIMQSYYASMPRSIAYSQKKALIIVNESVEMDPILISE
jgi:hypothetical protein